MRTKWIQMIRRIDEGVTLLSDDDPAADRIRKAAARARDFIVRTHHWSNSIFRLAYGVLPMLCIQCSARAVNVVGTTGYCRRHGASASHHRTATGSRILNQVSDELAVAIKARRVEQIARDGAQGFDATRSKKRK